MKKKLSHILLIGLLSVGLVQHAAAEATIEIYADFGFSITPFVFDAAGFDAGYIDPTPPEGKTVLRLGINSAGGMGVGNGGISNRSGYANGALRFWLKSSNTIKIEIEHTLEGSKSFANIPSTNNQWQEIILPLDASGTLPYKFDSPINTSNVIAMFLASNYTDPGEHFWEFDHIRWTKPLASMAIFPKSTKVNPGDKRQFTVEGRDAAGENVIIYDPFTAPGSVGSFNPSGPVRASTFTANTTDGNVTVTEAAISTSAFVDNTNADLNTHWGLLSETIPGIQLGTDSDLGVATGGGGTMTTGDSADSREGLVSFVSTVNVPTNGYAGWFIQNDLNPSDALTKDMNLYYDGSLRFWFKGPSQLQNILEVSIRSGNVAAGTEYSKVLLRNFVTFDNTWRAVAIPITHFVGAKPWADISRIKIYAAFFVVGNTTGQRAFYVDNLRWDTRIPGALATMTVSPNPANVPLSSFRVFTAHGFDANGTPVDIYPTWSKTGNIGSIAPLQGVTTLLTAAGSPATGSVTATQSAVSSTSIVNVADPVWTQSYNVYSDAGSGGYVGVAVNPNSSLTLSEQSGGAPEGNTFRRSVYTLQNQTNENDAYAIWFTNYDSGSGSRFMAAYEDGYLSFWVKTNKDLQVSIRSANITPGAELSKIRLTEYGIPLNNTFQKVVIPLSEFKDREPLLDFNQIQTYFAIGALSEQIGEVTNQQFDVDDVKWLTSSNAVPSEENVYLGLKEKQRPSGLVRSYDTLPQAVTYDQAAVAMNYTYRLDFQRARNIFNVYQTKFNGGYSGFHDEYNVDNPNTIIDSDRFAGPNAWVLLALLHYRNATGDNQYDGMIDGIASWLLSLQAPDGAIRLGYAGGQLQQYKATEHAFDCYSAFRAYGTFRNNPTYFTAADNIFTWLANEAYFPAQTRFYAGEKADGTPDTDKALDVYSWAPLAVSSFSQVLATAVTDLGTTQVCDLTGISVTGFDFGGLLGYPTTYMDAVWVEGTGQMAMAYYAVENTAQGDFYTQEIEKTIINTSTTNAQGMPYATNGGTGFGGFQMDSLHPAASPAAWYLFAKKKFNPFNPYPLASIQIRNISNDALVSSVTWSAAVPVRWVLADRYIRLNAQPITIADWGIQIYTDNADVDSVPRYVDPTPGNTINPDSDPSGLIWANGASTSSVKLPLAWRIQDAKNPVPSAVAPYTLLGGDGGNPQAYNWFFFKDQSTPAIDLNGNGVVGDPTDGTAFTNGEDFITIRKPDGIHTSQGENGYTPSLSPDYLYFEADHGSAAVGENYRTNKLTFEFFLQ